MTMVMDGRATMAGRWRQLLFWSLFVVVTAAAVGSAGYAYLHKSVFVQPQAPSGDATTVGQMKLAAQFAGPLKDTVVQRWEDPATGDTCYIYLPVVVQHSAPTPTGYVQYGANGIGSISCLH